MNLKQAKTFYDMMRNYLVFYKEFLEFESKKLDDVANNRIKLIDEHVKNEEVFLLKSRGLEVKRQAFLKELGLENMQMKEIIKQTPQEIRGELEIIFGELSETVLDLQEINKRCNSMIEIRLHNIDRTLNMIEESKSKAEKTPTKGEKKFTDFISRKV